MLQPGDEQGLVEASGGPGRSGLDPVADCAALKLAIERRETLLGDLPFAGAPHVEVETRTQLLGRNLLPSAAQAVRDVRAFEAKLPSLPVDSADDEVSMRVLGVVVIDRGPLDFATEVLLDLRHQAAHVEGEIQLGGVLRRDDDPKLVLLAARGCSKASAEARPVASYRTPFDPSFSTPSRSMYRRCRTAALAPRPPRRATCALTTTRRAPAPRPVT